MTYKHKITGTQAKLAEDGKYYIHDCSIGIPKQFIEDSKVWLKEDGYEILSFSSGYAGAPRAYIFKKLPNGLYSKGTGDSTLEHGLTYWDIFSIKRLSDGEIFSIFDKVSERLSDKKDFIIESFNIYHDRLVIGIKKKSTHTTTGFRFLDKVKEPIFTTFDGVEIYKNQPYWGLYTKTWLLEYVDEGIHYNLKEDELPDSTYLTFAKKENIEKYIKENKPQYSLNDIRNVLTKQMECAHWIMIDVDKIIKYLEK